MITLDTIKETVLKHPSNVRRMLAKYGVSTIDQLWPLLQAKQYPNADFLIAEMETLKDLEAIKIACAESGLEIRDVRPGEKGGYFFKDANGNIHRYDPRLTLKVPDYPCTTCTRQNCPKACEVCAEYAEYDKYLNSLGDENLSRLADSFARQRATTQLHQRYLKEAEEALMQAYMDREV